MSKFIPPKIGFSKKTETYVARIPNPNGRWVGAVAVTVEYSVELHNIGTCAIDAMKKLGSRRRNWRQIDFES